MSYSYPTRVVNGYWLRVFFVVLVFRLSNSVSVYFVNGWAPQKSTRTSEPSRKKKHIGFDCLSCAGVGFVFAFFFFFCFWWTPHGNWSKIFISTFSTTIDIQRFKLKTFSLIYMYIFFSLPENEKKNTLTNTVYLWCCYCCTVLTYGTNIEYKSKL